MSHFSVLVITDDANSTNEVQAAVEAALAPYHEFECTGIDDQYVQTIDITEKTRAEYNDPKNTRSMVRMADGTLLSAYDPSLWRKLTIEEQADLNSKAAWDDRELSNGLRVSRDRWDGPEDEYHARTPNYPEESEVVDVPVAEIMTFAEFVEYWHHYKVLDNYNSLTAAPIPDEFKYGYIETDDDGNVVRVMDRTNPDAHWDWWTIGGRYSERLFVNTGAQGDRGERSWGMEDKPFRGGLDSALLADINWGRMVADRVAERRRIFQREHPKYQAELALAENQEKIDRIKSSANFMWGWDARIMKTEDDYVGEVKPLTAFAVLYKGKWYESGSMGWFGMVADEKDPDAWEKEFQTILEDAKLNPTNRITVVDCHI